MDTCVLDYSSHLVKESTRNQQDGSHLSSSHSSSPSLTASSRPARLPVRVSSSLADLIPVATAALVQREDDSTLRSSFARALVRVRTQVQTRRLKEKYLGHEWIRLALGLPVDESVINRHGPTPAKLITVSPHNIPNQQPQRKCLDSRTGEIATWYEWRFDRSKFSVEEVESKVDRLRQRKLASIKA